MSKSLLLLFLLTFFHVRSNGEKNCKDIWSMDNSINGLTLYKVTINMCTEGIFVPDNLEETTTPAISFIDYNISNTNQILNITNSSISQNISKIIKNILFNETYLSNITNITQEIYIEEDEAPSPGNKAPSPDNKAPSPQDEPPEDNDSSPTPEIIPAKDNSNLKSQNSNTLQYNNSNITNNTKLDLNNDKKMDPIHIVLLSVGLTILGFASILIIYIIVKKHHNCNNKICSEDSINENKSSLYKKPNESQVKDEKHNVKLHINNQVDKLKALEHFKSKKRKGPLKRKTISKMHPIKRTTKEFPTRKVPPPPPKFPPGMNAEQIKNENIQKSVSQPKLHSEEKTLEIKKSQSQPKLPTTPQNDIV